MSISSRVRLAATLRRPCDLDEGAADKPVLTQD